MKTKRKIYSSILGIFFLSMFLAGFDKKINIAKADCYTACADYEDEQGCYDACIAEEGNVQPAEEDNNNLATQNEYAYTQKMCDDVYGGNGKYVPNANKTGCDLADPNGDYGDDSCFDAQGNWNNSCDGSGNAVVSGGKKGDSCTPASSWFSSDSCATGFTCNEGTCEVSTWGSLTGAGQEDAPAPTAEDKKNAAGLKAAAVTASNILNNAKKNKATADAVLSSCGQNCTQAQRDAANKANQDLVAAQAAFDEKIAVANEAYARAYPETASTTGAGFMLCANGAYAITCSADGGGGTPVVLGLGSGGGSFGGGFGNYGSGGKIGPKCGTDGNFQEIGGVCFPVNTGLSEAPITLILGNLFSWLMGLFTTFAVIAFVVSGIQYFMSSGDESMAEAAKDNAKNAAIGIVVGLSGFIIIKAIAAALSGQSYFF